MQEASSAAHAATSTEECIAQPATSSSEAALLPSAEPAPFSAPLQLHTHVAGVRHYLRRTAAQATAAGLSPAAWEIRPGQQLIAEREPNNPRDPHAIRLAHSRWKSEAEMQAEAEAASAAAEASAAAAAVAEAPVDAAVVSSSASVTPVAASILPALSDVRPLGHIPATLARFLSPLLLRHLITIEVHVQQPNEAAPDVASPSEAAAEDEKEQNDAAESPQPPAAPSALSALHYPSPSLVAAASSSKRKRGSAAEQVNIRIDIIPVPMEEAARRSLDRASRMLWTDLVAHLASLASESALTAQARLISNFHLITVAVLARFSHLFLASEIEQLARFKTMDAVAQGLFVRLMGRTRPARWFQLAALRYDAEQVRVGVEQLAAAPAVVATPINESVSAPPPVLSPGVVVPPPPFVRSQSTPVQSTQLQHEIDAIEVDDDDDSDTEMKECTAAATASPLIATPRPFLTRASSLSAEDWAAALPSMLHECTLVTIKELVSALGLSKLLSGQTTTATKQGLIVHLTKQRTLFGGPASGGGGGASSSLMHSSSTRKSVLQVCGDFVLLRPDFLLLAQRLQRLCFLQNDPEAPSPLLMEHLGLVRFRSNRNATVQTKSQTGLRGGGNEGMEVAASSSSSAAAAASSAPSPPPVWSLFPTRACFLAYDLSVQFLLQMHEVCDCVLATGEARKADQTYSAEQALTLLGEALRRLQLEVLAPDSTHMLDLVALSPNSVSQHSGKPRNAAAFSSFFGRAQSSPVAPASAAAAAPAASPALADLLPEVSLSAFRPLSPSHRDADRFFDPGVRGTHAFARPFRAASVYAECAHYGARVLEREKRYTQANALYYKLLSMPFDAERRGAWWNRLALNLETHIKDRPSAYAVCRLALADSSVRTGDLHELSVRTRRLWKHKEGGNARRPCPVPHVDSLPDFGRVRAVKDMAQQGAAAKGRKGQAVPKGTAAAAAAAASSSSSPASRVASLLDDSGYSSILTPDGVRLTTIMANPLGAGASGEHSIFFDASNASVRVEDLALSYYAREEFGSYAGRKDEGTVFRALFALLLFEVIFSEQVSDVFHTQYHDAPLDLGCASFYSSRATQIQATLESIRNCTDLKARVHAAWVDHHGFRVRGMNWRSTDLTMCELGEIAECMGGHTIAFVLGTMARDYAGWSGGLPDLCLWRPGCKPSNNAGMETSAKEKVIEVNLISSDEEEQEQDEEAQDQTMLSPSAASRTVPASDASAAAPGITSPPPPPPPPLPILCVRTPSPVSRSDVICISSDDDEAAALPSAVASAGKSKSMAVSAASAVASTPRSKSVKRVSSAAAAASAASSALKSSSSKRAKLASPAASSGQLSLTGFTAVSPRFAAPRFTSPPPSKTAVTPQSAAAAAASVTAMDAEFEMAIEASKRENVKAEQTTDAFSPSSGAAAAAASSSSPSASASAVPSSASWPSFKLVEVKGPGDRCSSQQVAWIAQLAKCKSCAVELCYVVLPEQAKRWK